MTLPESEGEGIPILPFGDSAFLMELPDLAAVLAHYRGLAAGHPQTGRPRQHTTGTRRFDEASRPVAVEPPIGVIDIVPAARTILVTFDPSVVRGGVVLDWIRSTRPEPPEAAAGNEVVIEVSYDGPDLPDVARHLGITVSDVVRLHTGSLWTAAFSGFAPGFVYLATDHNGLHVPRRPEPRTSVPTGAVGLAGEFSGVYPRQSPGGWQIIGTTTAAVWDASRAEPALIQSGDTVRFVEA